MTTITVLGTSVGLLEAVVGVVVAGFIAYLSLGVVMAWFRRIVVRLTIHHFAFGAVMAVAGWGYERFGGVVGILDALVDVVGGLV